MHAPGLQCLPSKYARPKSCLEELDGCTPKLVRLDNEDEGTPSRSKRHARGRLQVTRSNCPYFNFLLHIIVVIIMITYRLHKTCELRLRIFKCRDVIWIVMELKFHASSVAHKLLVYDLCNYSYIWHRTKAYNSTS